MEACLKGRLESMKPIIDLLAQTGAQKLMTSKRLNEELFHTVAAGDMEKMKIFLYLEYDLTVTDLYGHNVIHIVRVQHECPSFLTVDL